MPVGTKGTREVAAPGRGARPRRADPARQHLPPALPARRRADRASSAGCTGSWPGTCRSSPTPAASRSSRCATRSRGVDDDGVTFRSVYDGAADALHARARSRDPDEPRQRHRDVPRPGAARRRPARASSRTPCAARPRGPRASATRRAPTGQLRFGITQGGVDPELRRRSTEEIAALDFDGNAIGGLAIGEDREAMFETTDWSAALLPADKPRYFMGIGDPEGILEVIEAGVDMFDCVLPDAHRPHRQRAHPRRAHQPPQRPVRARPGAARRDLRLPRLHALHAGLHPPPRQPERAARPAPAVAPQSTLPDRADPRRARRDRTRRLRVLQARPNRKAPVGGFLILIVIFGAVWLLFVLPARRRQRIALGDAGRRSRPATT